MVRKSSEQFVSVPGGQVYVKNWTPIQATHQTPVILLHDSLGCVEMWRHFPLNLCERLERPVIAYDRLGFGQSEPRTEPPSIRFIEEEAEVYLPVLLKTLDIKKFALFGHSVGGAMAVAAAARFGSDCEAIITESAQAFVEDKTRQGIARAQAEFRHPDVFAKLEKYHGDKTNWVFRAWMDIWLSPEFASWSLANELPRVHCPVLALHGDRDEYGSVQFPEMICQLTSGPSIQQIMTDCGHVPHREKQEEVLTAVAQFLGA